jgi:hypothetical protein
VFSLGLRADALESRLVFEKALADPNPWVRCSAVKSLARNTKDRAALEARLAPLLTDTNLDVAATVAVALLEPEVRQGASMQWELNYFVFETVRGGRSQSYSQNEDRPLMPQEIKPPFLPSVRERLKETPLDSLPAFALLLAQYGEFDGVDRLVAQLATLDSDKDRIATEALLTGIALSRDAKYVPALKQMASVRHEEYELRKVLSALKGMTGPEARQLRLEINKKLRATGGSDRSMLY